MLAGAWPQVQHVRPDRGRAGVAGGPDHVGQLGWGRRTGRAGSAPSRRSHRSRRRSGSGARAVAWPVAPSRARSAARSVRSTVGMENVTPTLARGRGVGQHVDVADDQRATRDEPDRRPRLTERLDGAARQPEPSLGGLVRVRRRPDDDLVTRHDRRPSSRRSTSTRFVLTRIDVPYRASDGRSASCSNARTKQNVQRWTQPM